MEDNASLNRRSNLPTMSAPGRPQKQAQQILRVTITAQGKPNEPLQEQQITRTIKEYASRRRKSEKQPNPTDAQGARKRIQDRDANNKTEENEPTKETEMTADLETDQGGFAPDQAYQQVDTSTTTLENRLRNPLEEEEEENASSRKNNQY